MVSGQDINWYEGQFIQPHHFQQAFLLGEERQYYQLRDYLPFFPGVSHVEISEGDCENYALNVVALDCRLPDGTRITFPGNSVIESRSFKDHIDEHQGRLDVLIALPMITEMEPNCLRFNQTPMGGVKYRYVSKMVEVNDVVSGSNPQQVEVKLLNPKILFSDESTYGYDCIKIAQVERSAKYGSTPKLKREFVPPTIALQSSPFLLHIMRETANRLVAKNRILRAYWKNRNTAAMMKARDALKVQSVAAATNGFVQLTSADRIHPFPVYVKMAEIIGTLSIYTDSDDHVELPPYDHNDLGACFQKAEQCIVHLLAMLEEQTFESRVFEPKDNMLLCPMEAQWFEERFEHYICFESKLEETEVTRLAQALKVAPENLMERLNQRRIRGMDLSGPAHHLGALPSSPSHHYFKISRQHALFPKLIEAPMLAIWGNFEFSELTTLYIVEKKM